MMGDYGNKTDETARSDRKEDGIRSDPYFMSVPYGFQQKHHYRHNKKHTDLVDVTVNTRTRQFILLDTRGITTWTKDGISNTVSRSLSFPKYQNNVLRSIIFAKKFNVYFCLAHDFSLKVLNKNFEETCTADSDLSSVMFMVFNPVRDELITGGVKGTKIWEFKQIADRIWTEIKPMANYGLFLKKQLDSVGGSWVRKLELNEKMQHLYCCSDTDISCYDMDGKFNFKITRAHNSQITGCKYSPHSKMLVTGSYDTEVKVWSMTGGLVHTFRGHARAVTNVALHPESSSLVLTSSMDGTVRMWSMDIMEEIYSIVMSTEGIFWMGILSDKYLWTATPRELFVWNIDQTVHFFALARSKVRNIQVTQSDKKTTRVVAVGDDSSVRLVSMRDQRNLSTVLPPPSVSPLQSVLAVSYNRECSLVYLLINPEEIWVYTMRTDPACRTAVWDVAWIQDRFYQAFSAASERSTPSSGTRAPSAKTRSSLAKCQIRRPTTEGIGPCPLSSCTSLTSVTTHIMYWTDEGFVSPLQNNFLVLGLQDGRIVFLDPVKFGCRYCELQACKDAIIDLCYDSNNSLMVVRSHLREDDIFQIWSLPQLDLKHEVLARRDATCYAYSNGSFFVGHEDGSVVLYNMSGEAYSPPDNDEDGKVDHTQPVLSVDSCPLLGVFISCSGDGIIKVWNQKKLLCSEIIVEDSLTAAKFLNRHGDILIGYKNHLFYIHRSKVLASVLQNMSEREDSCESESDIYEDPAVKYEGAAVNPDSLCLETYLVPYNLDFSEKFLGGGSSPQQSQNNSDGDGDSDSDSGFSMAPTYLYNSPTSTPRRLSFVDLIIPGDCVTSEALRNQSVAIITKRKSGKLMLGISREQEVSQSLEDFDMPTFGQSPGPSPTPSPPSTPTDFNLSERESEDGTDVEKESDAEERREEKDELHQDVEPLALLQEPVKIPNVETPKKDDESFRLSNIDESPKSKYGFSSMKIDSKRLLKGTGNRSKPSAALNKQTPQRIIAILPGEDKKEDAVEATLFPHNVPIPKKKIEKKKQKGQRQRVGERGAGKVVDKEEEDEAIVAHKLPLKGKRSVHQTVKSGITMKPESKSAESFITTGAILAKPSVKNLSMDNDVRAAYTPPTSSITRNEGTSKKQQKKKKISMFSNYKKTRKNSYVGYPSTEATGDGEDELEDGEKGENDAAGTAMYRAASQATVVQMYNPLDRITGNTEEVSAPAPTPVEMDFPSHAPIRTNLFNKGRSHSAVQSRGNFLMQGVRAKSAGSKGEYPEDYPLELLPLDYRQMSEMSLDQLSSGVTENSGRGSLILSESDMGGILDESVRQSDQAPSTAMESLIFQTVSRPSTAGTLDDRATSLLSNFEDISLSRPMSGVYNPGSLSPEMQEIANLKESLRMMSNFEGYHARPNTAEGARTTMRYPINRRPHTAGTQMNITFLDELQFAHNFMEGAQINEFMSDAEKLTCTSPPPEIFMYDRNDGLNLNVNWQDKMIERHQLMKIQKELRIRSAADKRRLLDLRKWQKRRGLLGHHGCTDQDQGIYRDNYHNGILSRSMLYSSTMERRKSAPTAGYHHNHIKSIQTRRDQMTPSPSRKDSTIPTQKKTMNADSSRDQQNYASEKAYRFKLSKDLPQGHSEEVNQSSHLVATVTDEPTNRIFPRPHTSKSIPSKTRRYILITPNRSDSQMARLTPLESQLLSQRFPKSKERLMRNSSLVSGSPSVLAQKVIPNRSDEEALFN